MKNRKLLIVEDEGIVAMDLANRLRGMGYTVAAVAASGEKAIRATEETSPGLILMDIRLKGDMDGIEAAGQIQARFDIPVIFLTAMADVDTVRKAEQTAAYCGYVLKPFNEEELQAAIKRALSQHQAQRKSNLEHADGLWQASISEKRTGQS
jgi:CheY-like chemotaxis protein